MTRFPFRPRSLTGLILLGFVIVALPALLGTVSATVSVVWKVLMAPTAPTRRMSANNAPRRRAMVMRTTARPARR